MLQLSVSVMTVKGAKMYSFHSNSLNHSVQARSWPRQYFKNRQRYTILHLKTWQNMSVTSSETSNTETVSCLRNEFHFSEVYRSENYNGSSVQSEWIQKGFIETLLATQCSLHYKHQKINFIDYIYSLFNQNLDIKSNISCKTEAIKQLHAFFLLTAEQGQWRHGVATI